MQPYPKSSDTPNRKLRKGSRNAIFQANRKESKKRRLDKRG